MQITFLFRYELKGYDTKYEDYMKAFGIPVIILSFIIGTPETIVFTEPQEGDSVYTLKTITGNNLSPYIMKISANLHGSHIRSNDQAKSRLQVIM